MRETGSKQSHTGWHRGFPLLPVPVEPTGAASAEHPSARRHKSVQQSRLPVPDLFESGDYKGVVFAQVNLADKDEEYHIE